MMDISVVIPVRNEEFTIPELISRLEATLVAMSKKYEIIFVTDINTDRTLSVLKSFHEKNQHIKLIKLSNSFGQHVAILAGLEYAKAKSVVIMDGDLEMYPEDIPKLHAKLQEGYELVYGYNKHKNRSFINDLSSRFFNYMMKLSSDYSFDHNSNMFRILTSKAVNEVLNFKETQPSLTYIMGLINLPTTGIELEFGKREFGKTNYSLKSQFSLALNSILSFSTKPLRAISLFGFTISFFSFIYLLFVLVQKFFTSYGGLGWGTVIVLITFFGGIQLLAIGIIGEYIGRIFLQSKNRPRYVIEEKFGDL
jgi:polyisoprenyl-phosphate glycosyltransferase